MEPGSVGPRGRDADGGESCRSESYKTGRVGTNVRDRPSGPLVGLPVFQGGDAEGLFEHLAQVGLVIESGLFRHPGDGHVAFLEEEPGMVEPDLEMPGKIAAA